MNMDQEQKIIENVEDKLEYAQWAYGCGMLRLAIHTLYQAKDMIKNPESWKFYHT